MTQSLTLKSQLHIIRAMIRDTWFGMKRWTNGSVSQVKKWGIGRNKRMFSWIWTKLIPRATKCVQKTIVTFGKFACGGYDARFLVGFVNPNCRDCYKILLRKCIRYNCVITGTPKCARKCWPGSDTQWLGLPGHGAGVVCERSVDRNPGEPPHYCSPYFTSDRLFWLRG